MLTTQNRMRDDEERLTNARMVTELAVPRWGHRDITSLESMSAPLPLPSPSGVPVMKVEDEGNVAASGQIPWDEAQIMEMFRKGIGSLRRKAQHQQCAASGSGPAQLPPPPPVQQAPPLPPPPPRPPSLPPPPAQRTWAKRPAAGPPPGFAGVRQPPPKQYQRRPPWQQPPAPNAHRSPAPSVGPAPPANANLGGVPPPPPVNAGGTPQLEFHAGPVVVAARTRHSAAARKKPTVPCSVCGVLCMTAWHLKQHEKGRKHQNKLAYRAGEMSVRCQVCNVHLSSQLNVQQHYSGKQHLRRLTGAT
ncbi:hypothetical protein ACP4OV_011167 [Aristida adscensionis]